MENLYAPHPPATRWSLKSPAHLHPEHSHVPTVRLSGERVYNTSSGSVLWLLWLFHPALLRELIRSPPPHSAAALRSQFHNFQWKLISFHEDSIALHFFDRQVGLYVCIYRQGSKKDPGDVPAQKPFPSMKTNRNTIAEWKISIYHFDVSNYCLCNVCQLHLTWRCNTIPQQISAASSFKLLHINLFFWGWSKHEFIKRFQEK